ncbi:unnamed protein product [Oreochromis niloticus]|nr:unnamed protein product [Mustela putorius furo]
MSSDLHWGDRSSQWQHQLCLVQETALKNRAELIQVWLSSVETIIITPPSPLTCRSQGRGAQRVRGERSLLERVRQKERLREKKVNRQVQVRESKERQRSCSKWIERQRKIKLLQREESKQAKRGKMMKQLQQLILLQGLI